MPTPRPRRKPAAAKAAPSEPTPRPTLGLLLDQLGSGVVRILAAPRGLDVDVADVVIHDPLEPPRWHAGDLVLAVGVDPSRREVADLLSRAAEAGVAAVILRVPDAVPAGLVEAADSSGVAAVAVDPEMAWGQLHGLLRGARATAGEFASDRDPLGDLFSLANAVASMVGGPTTIEDPHSTVLAYSQSDDPIDEPRRQTILGRRVPDEWLSRLRSDGVFSRLWADDEVLTIDYSAEGLQPRLAVRVRAGEEILGSIWVAQGAKPFTADARPALAEAARIASLHLIRARSNYDLELRRRADLLRDALEGRLPAQLVGSALDFVSAPFVTVAAVELESAEDAERAALSDRLVSFVALYSEAYRRRAASTAIGRAVYVLLPDGNDPDRDAVLALVADVVSHAQEAIHAKLIAGVGPTVAGVADVGLSRRQADQTLRAMRADGVGPVAGIEHVRSRLVLLALADAARAEPALLAGKVDALATHDRDRGTEYVTTLGAYLDHLGDIPTAAAAIGIHANTFRYRLRRLGEVVDLDLGDPAERLVAHLQLQWLGAAAAGRNAKER